MVPLMLSWKVRRPPWSLCFLLLLRVVGCGLWAVVVVVACKKRGNILSSV